MKQYPRQWNIRFDRFIEHIGFIRSNFNHCVYFRFSLINSLVILLLYMDDILIVSSLIEEVIRVKVELNQEFEMKDL